MIKLSYDKMSLKNQKIDFVAVAITYWHVISINAFLYDLSNKLERKVNGLILIESHLNEKDFHYGDFADIELHFIDTPPENRKFIFRLSNFVSEYLNIFSGLRNIRSKEGINKLYLICPLEPYTSLLKFFEDKTISSKYNPVLVLVDEGFGTYVSKKTWNLAKKNAAKISSISDLISLMAFRVVDDIFKRMILRSIPSKNRFLFRNEGQLKINENICRSYKKVLKLRKNDLKINKTEKSILLITQPFSEYNQISVKDEFSLIESLIKFINKKGIKPIIKPHPYEKSDKYQELRGCDFEIIKNNFPVEEIILFLDPVCVIGYTSSALLNSKVFYGINAVSLSNILLPMANDKLLKASIEEFKNLTGNFINFVNNVKDIEMFI